jgi:hypothetical protein
MSQRSRPRIHRLAVTAFYLLAFLLSWLVWGAQIAQQHGLLAFHVPQKLAFFGVTTAAFVVASISGGRAGVLDLLRRMVRWRVPVRVYALAILVPALIAIVATGVHDLLGGALVLGSAAPLGASVLYLVTNTPFMVLTEEVGWRGFALPRLQNGRNALAASVVVGALWGLWHLPLFFIADAPQASYPLVAFLLAATAQGVIMTWIVNRARGSVLVAGLAHAATDAALLYSATVSSAPAFWTAAGVMAAAALLMVLIDGPARLVRTEVGDPSEAIAAWTAPARR